MSLMFTKRLREPIRRGEIDCTVRIWQSPRVKVGNRYAMEGGAVEVLRIRQIEPADITPVAKHGSGQNVYLIDFEFHPAD
eukprot:gene14068-13862_t